MSARSLGRDKQTRGANLLFLVIAVVGCVHALTMLTLEISRTVYTNREVARLERDIASLELEATDLGNVIAHRDDAVYREQLARLQGFIYPDEARYVTVTDTGTDVENAATDMPASESDTSPNTLD